MPINQDWDTIRAIPRSAFKNLFVQKADPTSQYGLANTCRVVNLANGSFHLCAMIETQGHGSYVIRVPAHGTAALWRPEHAWALHSEVTTMKYIHENTRVPIPKVFAYDHTGNNAIGAPYIIMEKMKGTRAGDMWYECMPHAPDWRWSRITSDERAHRKRKNFLKSLARCMAELGRLKFPRTGKLHSDDASRQVLPFSTSEDVDPQGGPAFSSCQELWQHKIAKNTDPRYGSSLFEDRRTAHLKRGFKIIFDIISTAEPFAHSRALGEGVESFVLNHFDLGLQNILIDQDGNVTGIIDWDGCRVVPRVVGYASLPEFLQYTYYRRTGWLPRHDFNNERVRQTLKKYQRTYATYMVRETRRASEVGDGKYTLNTEWYLAAYRGFIHGPTKETERLLKSLFDATPGLEAKLGMPFETMQLVVNMGKESKENFDTKLQDMVLPLLRGAIARTFKPRLA
jgi:aminoglycoside phosphotransferase (APT) family kinase protein